MSELDNQEVQTEEPNAVAELINQITTGELNKAEGSFQSIVTDKMADALEAQRIATAQAIFNDADEDLLDDPVDELSDEEGIIGDEEDKLPEVEDLDIEDEVVEDEVEEMPDHDEVEYEEDSEEN
jgi:hypothetical protein